MTILSVRNLSIRVGDQTSRLRPVDGVSFDIAEGECYSLLGESGCGKSMTALGIMRLLPEVAHVNSGEVQFLGQDLLALPELGMRGVRGGGIGMIFQEPATSLNPVLTIGQQIVESLQLHGNSSRREAREQAQELLAQVGVPDVRRRLGEFPFQLSGGLRQRVMIAIALAGNPKLLIADEPTTALDVTIQAQVLDLLDELRSKRGMALLFITHDLGVVARMADRIGVMYAGQLIENATRGSFFQSPAHPYSRRLFAALPDTTRRNNRLATISGSVPDLAEVHKGCRFVSRCNEAMSICHSDPPEWRSSGAGHEARCHLTGDGTDVLPANAAARESVSKGDRVLLKVSDLAVHFPIRRGLLKRTVGHVRAVDGLSFSLESGRTLALVGESGCGKTTVGKAILQLIQLSAGQVQLDGIDLAALSARRMRQQRAQIQMIFQDPFASLDPRVRVGDTIAEGMRALGVAESEGVNVATLLEQVGLGAAMATRYPHEFSGGQRQRIAIARALAVRPRIIVCDEPTSALDVSVQAQILNLLSDLQRDLNLTYLFITHNLGVVEYLAHEVAVMYLGRIVEYGTVAEVFETPRHPYTQSLLAAVPRVDGSRLAGPKLSGEAPSSAQPPSGCHFHPRCPIATNKCKESYPPEVRFGGTHRVKCFFPLGG